MPDRLRIFISSRVGDDLPTKDGGRKTLQEVRSEIRDKVKDAFDGRSVEVWINEKEPAEADLDAVERCQKWAKEAHLVVTIVNGHPGAKTPLGLGICHLELKAAVDDSPSKVLLIKVSGEATEAQFAKAPEFKGYFDGLWSTWSKFGASARIAEDVVEKSVQAIGHAVARMATLSLGEWRRGRGVEGEAFEWAKRTYSERSGLIVSAVTESMAGVEGIECRARLWPKSTPGSPMRGEIEADKARLVFTVTGVPDSFGVPEARKYAGYPFREDTDHLQAAQGTRALGPIHIVAVHKRVTESQIRAHVGNPDIAIIRTSFGYFSQDRSQATQVAYLTDITDSTVARRRAHELLVWLGQPTVLTGVKELARRRWRMCRREG
jgi:hypothetical protein